MRFVSFFAYLDPGTGSVVVQSLIGIAAGVGLFGRKVFSGISHKVKGIFTKSEHVGKSSEKS